MTRIPIAGMLLALASLVLPMRLSAQTPQPTIAGVIGGTVHNGTAGAPPVEVSVQLLAVPQSGQITAQQQTTIGQRFRFEAPADPNVTYLLRTEYEGVPYLDEAPILISRDLPTAERDVTVWETT